MNGLLAVAIGGAFGALARYWVGVTLYATLGGVFPIATLMVNAVGSLLIGICYVVMVEAVANPSPYRALVMIGFLGSFTTFSTFSLETLRLLEIGELSKALINVVANVAICLLGCWLGLTLARS